jgi:hypothetical protein
VAAPIEARTDSASVQVAASFDAFLIAFEAAFEWVHKYPSLCHEDKKEKTLRFLPESLLAGSMLVC